MWQGSESSREASNEKGMTSAKCHGIPTSVGLYITISSILGLVCPEGGGLGVSCGPREASEGRARFGGGGGIDESKKLAL